MAGYNDLVMGYIGNKRKLVKHIFKHLPKEHKVFLDLFAGSNIVGLTAKKQGYTVISNDVSPASHLSAKALVENHHFLIMPQLLFRKENPQNTLFRSNKDLFKLDEDQAILFDSMLDNAGNVADHYLILWVYAKFMPYNNLIDIKQKDAMTEGYWDAKKIADHKAWKRNFNMINKPLSFIDKYRNIFNKHYFRNGKENLALNLDWREAIKKAKNTDIVYCDPPYPGTASYDIFDWANIIATKGQKITYSNEWTSNKKFLTSYVELLQKTSNIRTFIMSIGNWDVNDLLSIGRKYRPNIQVQKISHKYNVNPHSKKKSEELILTDFGGI